MNKIILTLCFYLIFILLVTCERPDLTSDVESAYDYAERNSSGSDDNADSDIGDTTIDNGDTSVDTGDTKDESDSGSSSGSCTTIDGNMWSPKSPSAIAWYVYDTYLFDTVDYCDNLTACGYSDWHMPTISELRTLIQNCSGTVAGGSCGVTDSCLSYDDCSNYACGGCEDDDSGYYSKLGDTGWFCSSSITDFDDFAWLVDFSSGDVNGRTKVVCHVRCVR